MHKYFTKIDTLIKSYINVLNVISLYFSLQNEGLSS